jgi:hypothetical protein
MFHDSNGTRLHGPPNPDVGSHDELLTQCLLVFAKYT